MTQLDSQGGFGRAPEHPLETFPPIEASIGSFPISKRTGEPRRPWFVMAAIGAFAAASVCGFAAYWIYWWNAIHMTTFLTSSRLIGLLEPVPGSGVSILAVVGMAVIGLVFVAGPGIAAHHAWMGTSISRIMALVACATGLLAFFFFDWAWAVLVLSVVGAAVMWLPVTKPYLKAWDLYDNPPRDPISPPSNVAYGPAPRFA